VYFSEFRRDLLKDVTPLSIHLFQSRDHLFKGDEVLQENVIFSFKKLSQPQEHRYWQETSTSPHRKTIRIWKMDHFRQVAFSHFLSEHDGLLFFRLPTGILDEQILNALINGMVHLKNMVFKSQRDAWFLFEQMTC